MKREEETGARWWTFGHTAPWIAVLQVIAALAQTPFPKAIAGRIVNTMMGKILKAINVKT